MSDSSTSRGPARIIVFGNEKGGSGKSTAAMHLIVGLLKAGLRVGSIDVDARQATLSHYLHNRLNYVAAKGVPLEVPDHRVVERSPRTGEEGEADERRRFDLALASIGETAEVVVVDTPGSDNALSRHAHSYADTLVTPMNDSFIDLDLLAKIDPDTHKILRPSLYSEMVWEQKKARAMRDGSSIDWIVMRNRLGQLDARNKRAVGAVLEKLARRIGFRLAPGFGDRVVYRELFLSGLTMLDLRDKGIAGPTSLSHIAARQEVRDLLTAVGVNADRPSPPGEEAADAQYSMTT